MIHLRGSSADAVIDESTGAPTIVYWGAPLGDIDLDTLAPALFRPVQQGSLGVVAPLSVLPEHGSGFQGRPGLQGHRRGGRQWAPRFRTVSSAAVHTVTGAGVRVEAVDEIAQLRLVTTVSLGDALAVECTLVNDGDTRYLLDALHPTLPLPAHASELLTFDGRWTRELHPVRRDWGSGVFLSENRAGRTSHEHPPLVYAGSPGFGEWHGDVWGVHVAWSGNHSLHCEAMPDGRRYVQGGELIHPGELCLEPGEPYVAPTVLGVYGQGVTPASWGFHRWIRHSPAAPNRPRPVLLNTWEAVYFDHDNDTLKALATEAAALGIERFVLDDGWFGSRRDDTSGLGDWWVSPEVYPNGLAPIIDHVRALGMEFGIWVEPEMVNPDSDLYREHPDWALTTSGYEPVLARNQLVLDLANEHAFEHVLGQLDALLRDHDVQYVKWDMNRNHVQGSGSDDKAGSHRQTLALYRLLDELRARHPGVEIESCASGGARIDLEILQRTERVWTSDCNDALERQTIQWGASMLIPNELMGAHIGPTRSHTTGRVHSLAFRALSALFGHLGVEWNVLSLNDAEREQLAAAIALHQRFRSLVHGGDTVRFDPVRNGQAASSHAYGVYSPDRSEALVAHVQLTTGMSLLSPPLRLQGLPPDVRYTVEQVPIPGSNAVWEGSGIVLTGAQLASHGVQLPRQHPESGILLHLTAGTSSRT
jgi:alpha-galactosidase